MIRTWLLLSLWAWVVLLGLFVAGLALGRLL